MERWVGDLDRFVAGSREGMADFEYQSTTGNPAAGSWLPRWRVGAGGTESAPPLWPWSAHRLLHPRLLQWIEATQNSTSVTSLSDPSAEQAFMMGL